MRMSFLKLFFSQPQSMDCVSRAFPPNRLVCPMIDRKCKSCRHIYESEGAALQRKLRKSNICTMSGFVTMLYESWGPCVGDKECTETVGPTPSNEHNLAPSHDLTLFLRRSFFCARHCSCTKASKPYTSSIYRTPTWSEEGRA